MKGYGKVLAGITILLVLILTGVVGLTAIGRHSPFFTRGEPREALVVQTIVRGDAFILPMRNGDELPSKPPLFHWLAAAVSVANGQVTEGSIRLPGLIASLVTVAATAAAAWVWWGPPTAALTAIILVTSFQWLSSSVSARVDMILAANITLALLLFARAMENGQRIPVLAYAFLTAAVLTKGPVGLVLPCGIALVTAALRRELRFLGWRDLRLLVIATAAGGLWYAAAIWIGGDDFFAKQILKENVFRVLDAESVDAGHVEAFWYYIPLLAAGLAPWSLFIPGLLFGAFATSRETRPTADVGSSREAAPTANAAQAREPGPTAGDAASASDAPSTERAAVPPPAPLSPYRPRPPAERRDRFDPHTLFAVVWGGLTFALFSVAGSKRAVYLLPAYPAYAMLLAGAWIRLLSVPPRRIAELLLSVGAVLSAGLLMVVGFVEISGTSGIPLQEWLRGVVSNADANNVAPMMEAAAEHRAVVLSCAAGVLACAWFTLRSMRRGQWAGVAAATAVAMLTLSATVATTLLPALAQKRSTRSFLTQVAQKVATDVPLSFYRAFDYGAVFYRGAAIPVRSSLSDVPELDGAWLLTWPAFLPDLKEEVRKLDTGGEAAGAYEVEEAIASKDVDPSDKTSLVLVRIVRRIGDEHSDRN